MSRNTKRRANARQPTETRVRTTDSFSNPFARLGFGTPNLMETASYPITRLTQNYALLNSLYRNDWIASRIIDALPHDMVKNWYSITSQLEPDQISQIETVERKTYIKQRILDGLQWGRLFGGTAGIMIIEGQEDMLCEPLDLSLIMPGQFKGIIIADRWNGVYPDISIVQDLSDPDFGLPEYYTFSMSEMDIASGIRVHHSRVLRFVGRELPYVERMSENWWGMSELEHVYTELNKRNTSSANIAQLIFQANIRTYKMSDLGELLMATDPQSQKDLYQTLTMQNFLMSNMGMNIMDKDDDFVTNQYTFSGLSDIYELFMMDVAGAAEIPVTRLFGRSPAGMNATGESDLRNYYDKVRQMQESILRPVLEKLLPVMCMSTWGTIPKDLDFEFNPVRDTSDQERANLIQQSSGAITSVFQAGIISQQTALKELRQSGATYGMWSNITDEDIEKADDGTMPEMGEYGEVGNPTGVESPVDEMPEQMFDGGAGSGNFGHNGRPGEVGGSGGGGSGGGASSGSTRSSNSSKPPQSVVSGMNPDSYSRTKDGFAQFRSKASANEFSEKCGQSVKLSKDQKDTLEEYQVSSAIMNQNLRSGDDTTNGYSIRDLDKAISKAALPDDVMLFRGVSAGSMKALGITSTNEADMKKLVGKTLSDKAYLSTTSDQSIMEKFMQEPMGGKGVGLLIKAAKGSSALPISAGNGLYGNRESEFILPRDSKLKVTSFMQRNGRNYLVVTYDSHPSYNTDGGAGSGNFGHGGRPGEVGGSGGGGGSGGSSRMKRGKDRGVSASDFKQRVASGKVNTTLRTKGGTNKHKVNSVEYGHYRQERRMTGKPDPSYFTIKNPETLRDTILSNEVQSKAKTVVRYDGVIVQTIYLDKPVGISYNKRNEPIETNRIVVEYSDRHGMHYRPMHEENDED